MGWRSWTAGVALAQLVFAGWAHAEDNEFAFVFQCDAKKSTICLTTKYPSGQKEYLLGSKSDVCPTETNGTFKFQRGPREKSISRIEVGQCPNKGSYFLAYGGKTVSNFRRYTPATVASAELVNKVDSAIKGLKFYSTANEYFGNTLSSKPTVIFPIPGNENLLVAQYVTQKPKGGIERYGPVYMFINGEIREIASEASLGYLFTMDDHYYMTYRAGCWQGCGILAEVLVEISSEGFRKILIDGFFGV
jgi:hypothetical protein